MRNAIGYSARQKALQEKAKKYFTGLPCKHGHISERFTKNRSCVACYEEFLKRKRSIGNDYKNRRVRVMLPKGIIPGARVFIEGKQVA